MNQVNEIQVLKKELEQALSSSDLDYGQILELAGELSRHDPEYVRFTVDAGLISKLGYELVQKQETAVSELVKNSYDADATFARITFIDCNRPGGRLLISDNGNGMDREQLINGFMRLSSTDKIHNPISPVYKRTRAGKKGIGRFAAQRLGRKLVVTTQTEDSPVALKVEIDWLDFQEDQELALVTHQIQEVEKKYTKGTILMIVGLSETWSMNQIERVFRYLTDLVQPFPLAKIKGEQDFDPGFEINIFHRLNDKEETIASVETLVYEYALAEIEGVIGDDGKAIWSIISEQEEINEQAIDIGKFQDEPESRYDHIRNTNFRAYYYIYNRPGFSNYLPAIQNKHIRDLAKERGGIRVYRNGFRVLPYGEPKNDWLRLDETSRRRKILPPFGNQAWFGFVELFDITGQVFEETTSREGLIQNDAYRELVDFVYRVLESAVIKIAEARGRKAKPTSSEATPPLQRLKSAVHTARRAADSFSKRYEEARDSDDPDAQFDNQELGEILHEYQSVIYILETAVKEEEIREAELLEEISMLRILASLGLSIVEFTHEIKQRLLAIGADIKSIQDAQPNDLLLSYANRLDENFGHFATYATYFDRAGTDSAHREMEPQEMGRVLRSFQEIALSMAIRNGIDFPEPTIVGYDLFTIPMHPSEWASILFNLFTNSIKAIRRANSVGNILLTAKQHNNYICIQFSDNGDGIATEIRERIFDAFYTTTSPANPQNKDTQEELTGTGLGLKIVKDIVESYNGNIFIVDPPDGYVTCFQIEIPATTQEEWEKYGY